MAGQSALYQLAIELGLDTTQLKKGASDAVKTLNRFEQSAKSVDKKLSNLGASFARSMKALGVAGAIAGATRFAGSLRALADELSEMSDMLGISTDSLQAFQYGASFAGISTEQLNKAMAVFVRHVGEAQAGTGEFAKTMQRLGIAGGTTVEDTLRQFADALDKLPTQAEKLKLATEAFGKVGPRMVNVLAGGAAGIDAMTAAAKEAGVVMDGELIKKTQQWNDSLERSGKVLKFSIGVPLLEALATLAEKWHAMQFAAETAFIQIRAAFQRFFAFINGMGNFFLSAIGMDKLAEGLHFLATQVERLTGKDLSGFKVALEQLMRPPPDVYNNMVSELARINAETDKATAALELQAEAWMANDTAVARAGDGYGETAGKIEKFTVAADGAKKATDEWGEALTEIGGRQEAFLSIYQESISQGERYAIQLRLIEDAHHAGTLTAEAYARALEQLNKDNAAPIVDHSVKIKDASEAATLAVNNLAQEFSGDLTDALFDANKGFLDFAESFLTQIAKMIIQAQIFSALSKLFAGSSWLKSVIPVAAGGVFGPAGVVPFARGGVVGGPTLFPFASGVGLMGEAGPEAVMPLTRRNGRLGVEGGGVTVNVVNNAGADVQVNQDPGGQSIDILIERKLGAALRSGALDRQLRANYGVRRRGE